MVYVPERSMVYVSTLVYLDRDEFPIADAMAEKNMKEQIREAGLGPRIDVKTRWNEGMVGVRVNEGNNIALMGEAQKERLREMLEPNPLEE
eukprot:3451209-Rhodomonas_salina.1